MQAGDAAERGQKDDAPAFFPFTAPGCRVKTPQVCNTFNNENIK